MEKLKLLILQKFLNIIDLAQFFVIKHLVFFIYPGKHPLFIIERYDRKIKNNQKYEDQGGPSIIDNFHLIKKYVSSHHRFHDLNAFLTWICFNLLIGNNDSHSKNISLLMDDKISKKHLAKLNEQLELRPRTFEDLLLRTIEFLEVHYALVSNEVQDEFQDCKIIVRIN